MITIPLTNLNLSQASQFATQVVPTTAANYANRNQGNTTKLRKDSWIGHVGELAWEWYLKQQGYDVTPVNSQIYNARQKNWAPDLRILSKNANIHVKSQDAESAKRFEISWTFQLADGMGRIGNGHTDPVTIPKTTKKNDWFAFAVVGEKEVRLSAIFPALWAHERNLWGLPKLERLQRTKVVIYFDDLKTKLGSELWSIGKL